MHAWPNSSRVVEEEEEEEDKTDISSRGGAGDEDYVSTECWKSRCGLSDRKDSFNIQNSQLEQKHTCRVAHSTRPPPSPQHLPGIISSQETCYVLP